MSHQKFSHKDHAEDEVRITIENQSGAVFSNNGFTKKFSHKDHAEDVVRITFENQSGAVFSNNEFTKKLMWRKRKDITKTGDPILHN